MPPTAHRCQSCGEVLKQEIAAFSGLPRVTSDSKPFRSGGRLFVCGACALVQKIADETWRAETAEIYRDYEMYYQSGSTDQPVFDPQSGQPSGRCTVLSRRLAESGQLPRQGSLLDVGAGAGAMLAAFSDAFPGWRLFGLDLDERKVSMLKAISRFERLYTVPPEQVGERFDLITLIHALEHFPAPLAMLERLRERLGAGGRLFVQVNNVERTPFDLVVADHLCHFSPATLSHLLVNAGFVVEKLMDDWVNKEISLLAKPNESRHVLAASNVQRTIEKTERDVAWLARMFEDASAAAQGRRFGIFGTSVAATWLASGLGERVQFFVDEDPARQGRTHLSRPVFAPAQVPAGSVVYLAFVREVAAAIRQRLGALPVTFAAPFSQPA